MLASKLSSATLRVCLALLLTAALQPAAVTAHAADPASMEAQVLTLLNQDRAGAGLPPLSLNSTMSAIARDAPISVCPGQTVHGRSRDMIERNYFAHQIPACNAPVTSAVEAAGVSMQPGAETLGYNNYPADQAVVKVNQAWLNSPPHRAAIMGDFRQVGIGAWVASGSWRGGGAPLTGVIMFSAIFSGSGAAGALPAQASSGPRKSAGPATARAAPAAPRPQFAAPQAQAPIVTDGVARAVDGTSRPASAVSPLLAGALPTSGLLAGAACGFLGSLAVGWRGRRRRA